MTNCNYLQFMPLLSLSCLICLSYGTFEPITEAVEQDILHCGGAYRLAKLLPHVPYTRGDYSTADLHASDMRRGLQHVTFIIFQEGALKKDTLRVMGQTGF